MTRDEAAAHVALWTDAVQRVARRPGRRAGGRAGAGRLARRQRRPGVVRGRPVPRERPGQLAGRAGRASCSAGRSRRPPGSGPGARGPIPSPTNRVSVAGMGEEVDAQEFSRADRTRYREKVRRCLDVFARMLREARFDTDDPMTGLEVELNLVDEHGDPALKSAEALAAIADPAFQTELGQFNIEINVPPAKLREGGLATFEEMLRREPQRRGGQVRRGRRPPGDDRHPADPGRRAHDRRQPEPQPALQAAQRADPQRPRRGHLDLDRRHRQRRAPRHHLGLDRPRGGVHQHPVPRPDVPRRLRRVLERLAGDLRRSSSPSAPTRPTCSARSCGARPGSRSSSRPPTPAARS